MTRSVDAIILFDDVCNLCSGFVQLVIEHDPEARFRFAALQSEAGQRLLAPAGLPSPAPDTLVLLEDGRAFTRSTAALRIARRLRFPWPIAYGFILVPSPLRDAIYDGIARRRSRWFGERERCMVPTPDARRRFID